MPPPKYLLCGLPLTVLTANLPLLNSRQSNTLEKHTNLRYLNLRCRRRIRHATNTHTPYGTAAPYTSPLPSFQTQQNHAVVSLHTTHNVLSSLTDPVVVTKRTHVPNARRATCQRIGPVSKALRVEASDWVGHRTVPIDTRPVHQLKYGRATDRP